MSAYRQKTIRTASWYIPWDYKAEHHTVDLVKVHVTNGAGQHVFRTAPMTMENAMEYVDNHRIKRAQDFGALVEVVTHVA